ncbi:MAG TPA: hypothetical protein VNT99_19285 [Methylomirabilota bacterium]|nr:hypothetical protein [Methylomirabilota bacterium]
MEVEARPATDEEKALLVKYVGWGAMPQVFDDFNPLWLEQREALRKELAKEEYEFARSTTLNAHYTSPIIIGAMYQALERFGFQAQRRHGSHDGHRNASQAPSWRSTYRPGMEGSRGLQQRPQRELHNQRVLCCPAGNDARQDAVVRAHVSRQRADA